MFDSLFPFAGWDPGEVNAAEKAAAGSSLETFLMTSILEVCLAPGGFSVKYNHGGIKQCQNYRWTESTVVKKASLSIKSWHLTDTLKSDTTWELYKEMSVLLIKHLILNS